MLTVVLFLLSIGLVSILFFIMYKNAFEKYSELMELTIRNYYVPFFGHIFPFLKHNIFVATQNIVKNQNLPGVIWEFNKPTYLTNNADEIKVVLTHSLEKNSKFKYLKNAFGNSTLVAPVEIWRKNRRLLSKSFHQNILESFVSIFYDKSGNLVEVLKQIKDQHDIFDIFEKYAMECFLATSVGIDEDIHNSEYSKLIEHMTKGQEILIKRLYNPLFWNNFMFNLFGDGKRLKYVVDCTHDFFKKVIIQKRIKKFVKAYDYVDKKQMKSIMDLLLEVTEEEKMNDEEIVDEIQLFFHAVMNTNIQSYIPKATDTSGFSLSFLFTVLGMYPDIQEKVYEEVNNVIGLDREIYYWQLPTLKYTEMVIKETLRIFPVIPIIGRCTSSHIQLGKTNIPENTDIGILIYNLHHNEKYWKNPEIFDPDRFSPENIANIYPCSFIPFSSGPRNCIGIKYAMFLMTVAVANVVRNFKISSGFKSLSDFKLVSHIVLKTTHKLNCKFSYRKI